MSDLVSRMEHCAKALKLFQEFEWKIRSIIAQNVRNRHDAEDILQEVFVRILAAPTINPDHPVAYICTLTRNICTDFHRSYNLRKNVEYVPDVGDEDFQDRHAERASDVCDIHSAEEHINLLLKVADGLPAKKRRIFLLRKIYGFSQKEIAAGLGISENTVEQHLTKAVLWIGNQLEATGDADKVISIFRSMRHRIKRREDAAED